MINEGSFDLNLERKFKTKIDFINKIKSGINYKLNLIKFILLFLIIYVIFIPLYIIIINLINNAFSVSYSNLIFNSGIIISIILFFIFIAITIFVFRGNLPYKNIFPIIAFILLLLFDNNFVFWPLKTILIFFLYKLSNLLEIFQTAYNNYSDFSSTYFEILRLDNVIDFALRTQIKIGAFLIGITYALLFIFEISSIDIGFYSSTLISFIILPVSTVLLFNSQIIFKSLKRKQNS